MKKTQHVGEVLQRSIAILFLTVFVLFNATQFVSAQEITGLPPGQLRVFHDDILGFNIEESTPAGACTTAIGGNGADLPGSDNQQRAFAYFITVRGLTAVQSAGIVANLQAESGLNPAINQDKVNRPTPLNGVGFGIGQWTFTPRQDPLVQLAKTENKPPTDFVVQLDYVWQELNTTYKAALEDLRAGIVRVNGKSPAYNAAVSVMVNYEAPQDHSFNGPNAIKRGGYAEQILARYGGNVSTASGGATVGSTTCGAGVGGVACSGTSTGPSTTPGANTGVSQVRQNAVCLAQQELKAWQQPGVKPQELCKRYGADKGAQAPWCEEWCADFVSWIYDQAKYPLKPDPNWRIPAVVGVKAIGLQNGTWKWHAAAGYTPKPGDLAIHDIGGSHVNMVTSVTGQTITMIGGDQGPGPNYGGPNSDSVVSQATQQGSSSQGTSGYVTPD